jgi:hypothetical protein
MPSLLFAKQAGFHVGSSGNITSKDPLHPQEVWQVNITLFFGYNHIDVKGVSPEHDRHYSMPGRA